MSSESTATPLGLLSPLAKVVTTHFLVGVVDVPLQDAKKTVSARVSMIAGLYLLINNEFIYNLLKVGITNSTDIIISLFQGKHQLFIII